MLHVGISIFSPLSLQNCPQDLPACRFSSGTWGLHLPQDDIQGEDAITLQQDSSIMEAGSIAAKRNGIRKHWLRNHRNPFLEVTSSWISCTVEASKHAFIERCQPTFFRSMVCDKEFSRRVTSMDRHQLAEFFDSFLMLQAPEESEGGPEEARCY